MSEELIKFCHDCFKFKQSVYENKLFEKASKEQEDAFYRMIDSLINRLSYYMEQNSHLEQVKIVKETIEKLENENDRDYMSYKFEAMKNKLTETYLEYKEKRNSEANFIASIEPTVFYPIRIIVEKLYRELTKNKLDESLDGFFEDRNI